MRKRLVVIALGLILTVSAGGVSPALADVAPPHNPPGSSVSTGRFQTSVQMVSEKVLMTISDYTPPVENPYRLDPFSRGHVDATFNMQNQGTDTESFDVWFPIGADTGYGVETVDNFQAWVDGVPAAKIGRQDAQNWRGNEEPWATWPVTFPPGKPVRLVVSYDTYGRGFLPYATFTYVLHTGAGWYGPIGEGTVTFRLPYDVTELNAATSGDLVSPMGYPFLSGGPFIVSGRDVVWHFTNLEPTEDNDIALTVLQAAVWRRIVDAQAFAAANPKSIPAQLDLARTAQQGMSIKGDVVILDLANTLKFVPIVADAYEAALQLDPKNLDIYVEYLTFLSKDWDTWITGTTPHNRYTQALGRAHQLAPDDPRLADLQNRLDEYTAVSTDWARYALTGTIETPTGIARETQWAATDNLYATLAEGVRLGVIPPPTATSTLTDEQRATEYPSLFPLPDTPTGTSTPTGTPTATATAVATPAAISQAAPSGNVQEWTAFVLPGVIVVIIAATWLRRRARRRNQPGDGGDNPS